MIHSIRVFLWGIVSELEYQLYPWKTRTPPSWAIERHNLPDHHDDELDEVIYKEWIRAHDDKISRLQSEMIAAQREIHKLKDELKQCMKN